VLPSRIVLELPLLHPAASLRGAGFFRC
jgi:hypothetical protein